MDFILSAVILGGVYLLAGIIRWAIIFKIIEIVANMKTKEEKGDGK